MKLISLPSFEKKSICNREYERLKDKFSIICLILFESVQCSVLQSKFTASNMTIVS